MPTIIGAANDGEERAALSASEKGGVDFAPDVVTETHGDAKSTGARFTMVRKDSLERGTTAGANEDVRSNMRQHGEESGFEKSSDSNMENVDRSNDYEVALESAIMNSTSNDSSTNENAETQDVNRSAGGTEEKTSVEEFVVDDSLAWNSGMKLDEIGRSRQPLPPESMALLATKPTSFRNKKQDVFVKKGARARALLNTALKVMADGLASNAAVGLCVDDAGDKKDRNGLSGRKQATDNDDDECPRKTWNARTDFSHVQDIAKEKSKECTALKRKLQESQSHIEVLSNENSTSQQSNTQLKAKIDRTLEALQIAGANAANARGEADASNARCLQCTCQLNDLQSVIEETKRGMEVVRREHDEVSRAARSIEGRLIQVEGELTRAARAKKDAMEERDFLKARAEKSEKLAMELQDKVYDYHDEVRMLKKDLLEMEELEKVRADRAQRIESEFQEARVGLLEATSAAAEAESTVTSLRSVIEELRQENESLHEQMNTSRDSLAKDRSKQNEALILAGREAQKLKMKYEEADEEVRGLKMDKTSAERQVDQLKSRVVNMERRLNDSSKQFSRMQKDSSASFAVTPHNSNNLGFINAFGANDATVVSEENSKRKYVAELPQRESSKATPSLSSRHLTYSYRKEKENKSNVNNVQGQLQRNESFYVGPKRKAARTNTCCLCSKEGGMILSCQCESINCDKRAHALCIGKFRSGKNNSGQTILCREVGECR